MRKYILKHTQMTNTFDKKERECIPVRCVPPASVAISIRGGCLPGGGVCLGGDYHTPCGQTDACENIILPQSSFAGDNNTAKLYFILDGSDLH